MGGEAKFPLKRECAHKKIWPKEQFEKTGPQSNLINLPREQVDNDNAK
jgi:hypothetical protein